MHDADTDGGHWAFLSGRDFSNFQSGGCGGSPRARYGSACAYEKADFIRLGAVCDGGVNEAPDRLRFLVRGVDS
jgi:hypothetical protein